MANDPLIRTPDQIAKDQLGPRLREHLALIDRQRKILADMNNSSSMPIAENHRSPSPGRK